MYYLAHACIDPTHPFPLFLPPPLLPCAPLGSEEYAHKFDYSATYELDSTIPITCIHPHWDAKDYLAIAPKDFDHKDGFGSPGAAAMFTSNCRNAGAEVRRVGKVNGLVLWWSDNLNVWCVLLL